MWMQRSPVWFREVGLCRCYRRELVHEYGVRAIPTLLLFNQGQVADQIVGLSAPQVRQVLSQLKQIGIKALVSRSKPGFVNDDGWSAIPRTDIYVRML